jgi:hypothetical protein
MKQNLIIALFALSTSVCLADPPLESVSIQKFLAPSGFDTNDIVQIQVVGTLPTTCHYLGPAEVYKAGTHVDVKQYAYKYTGTKEFCLQMKIPYTATITLGQLDKTGDWDIRLADTGATIGKLNIVEAPEPKQNPDTMPYAPVDDASIELNPQTKNWEARLKVHFRNECAKLKKVHVDVQTAQETILVRPEADYPATVDPIACPEKDVLFTHTEVLPAGTKGVWLLHVRAANGRAINKLSILE